MTRLQRRNRLYLLAAVTALLLSPLAPTVTGTEPAARADVPLDELRAVTTQVAFGLSRPTSLTSLPDGSGRLLIAEKRGTVRAFHPDTGLAAGFVLDIRDRVDGVSNERGLLGITPAPDFAQSSVLYLAYTRITDDALTLSRIPLNDPTQEQVLLTQEHAQFGNHNGGQVAFGPDGFLYWSLGDGGSANDPFAAGQDLATLLGKIVRIDVSQACGDLPYCIPADNPFVDVAGARGEIWHYGLRNPWRFSFDAQGGSMWIADVGQGTFEEVNHVAAGQGGVNFGWSCMEGPEVFNEARCVDGTEYTPPVFHYSTSFEGCAVIGGFVYRGEQFADLLDGTYVTTDYCSSTVWAVRQNPDGSHSNAQIGTFPTQVTSLAPDANGELYLVNDLPGQLHRVSFEHVQQVPTCTVNYRIVTQWGTGFVANVTVTNTGTEPVNSWSVGWTFAGDQRVMNGWNVNLFQSGTAVLAASLDWNGTIAPGEAREFGFLGSHSGQNPMPETFTLNGSRCG